MDPLPATAQNGAVTGSDQDPSAADRLGLPPIDQVSYMVHDLDEAMARFDPLFGPFTHIEADNPGSRFRGEIHDATLRVAFGRSGDLEVELIEHVAGECPHKEWIERRGECLFHVRHKVEDVDHWIGRLAEAGFEVIWYNDSLAEHGIKYAYTQVAGDPDGHILELVQGL